MGLVLRTRMIRFFRAAFASTVIRILVPLSFSFDFRLCFFESSCFIEQVSNRILNNIYSVYII